MNFGEGERSDDQYTCDKEDQEQEELQDQVEEDEEEVMMTSSKLPFSPSSSSSSSKYKNLLSQHQHHHHQQQHHHQNLWLGSFDSSSSSLDTSKELPPPNFDSKKLDLMDFSLATNNSSNEPDTTATTATTTTAGGAGGSSGGGGADSMEREHMFDKVVTPSDVGKLNRLVIPKQHAEKYFPLDSSSTEKGLLLNFEDRNGKSWRFRYSYWNSSQSYVMTKGWSRFVKEKKLDAGDIVSFQRGVGDAGKHRLYIDWRRRPNAPDPTAFTHLELQNQLHFSHPVRWGRLYSLPQSLSSSLPPPRQFMEQQQPPPHPQFQNLNYMQPYHHQHQHHPITSYGNAAHQYYMRPPAGSHPHQMGGGGGGVDYPYQHQHHHNYNQNQYHQQQQQYHQQQQPQQHHAPMVIDSVPVAHGKTVGKRLRLFGVNMECPTTQDDQSSSSTVQMLPPHHHHHHPHHLPPSSLQSRQQQQQHSAASSVPAAEMQAELSKKGKSSSSLSFDLDL